MKRELVLRKIMGILECTDHPADELAENILATLEDLGMSPPPDMSAAKIDGMILCQWEDEDDF